MIFLYILKSSIRWFTFRNIASRFFTSDWVFFLRIHQTQTIYEDLHFNSFYNQFSNCDSTILDKNQYKIFVTSWNPFRIRPFIFQTALLLYSHPDLSGSRSSEPRRHFGFLLQLLFQHPPSAILEKSLLHVFCCERNKKKNRNRCIYLQVYEENIVCGRTRFSGFIFTNF